MLSTKTRICDSSPLGHDEQLQVNSLSSDWHSHDKPELEVRSTLAETIPKDEEQQVKVDITSIPTSD